jgi:hypothetical protein
LILLKCDTVQIFGNDSNKITITGDCIQVMLPTIQSKIFLSLHLLSENLNIRVYKSIILPVDLYKCETWSLPLREEHRPRMFDNMVLKRIFESARDQVIGHWRNLH